MSPNICWEGRAPHKDVSEIILQFLGPVVVGGAGNVWPFSLPLLRSFFRQPHVNAVLLASPFRLLEFPSLCMAPLLSRLSYCPPSRHLQTSVSRDSSSSSLGVRCLFQLRTRDGPTLPSFLYSMFPFPARFLSDAGFYPGGFLSCLRVGRVFFFYPQAFFFVEPAASSPWKHLRSFSTFLPTRPRAWSLPLLPARPPHFTKRHHVFL